MQLIFAQKTFKWDSESSDKAAVHCVIIGMADKHISVVNYPTPKGGGLQLDFSTAFGWLTSALQNAALRFPIIECLKA